MKKVLLILFAILPAVAGADGDAAKCLAELERAAKNYRSSSPDMKLVCQENIDGNYGLQEINKKRLRELQDNSAAMKAKEQSDANKLISGASMAATGIGAMQLMQGLAEKSADKEGAAEMAAYLGTFRCGISGNAHNVKGGEPGEAPAPDLMQLRTDYATLALKVKDTKEAIGMKAGIESELELARAGSIGQIASNTDGLYENEAIGKTANRFSTARERLDSGEADKKIQTGAILAGAGIVGGIAGNLLANKNAPKERSDEINAKYDREIEELVAKLKYDLAGIKLPAPSEVSDEYQEDNE